MTSSGRTVAQVCPWYNKEEFQAVRRGLFSNNLFQMSWAVDRLTLWESKCHPGLEIGMEATLYIASALIQDELFKSNSALCRPLQLRSLYCTGFMRFVNVIAQVVTNKQNPNSMRTAAQKMGIPEWILHLRNDGCHGHMPSLSRFRSAAAVAFQWLNDNFWEVEEASFTDFIPIRNSECDYTSVISYFQTYQFDILFQNGTSFEVKRSVEGVLKTIRQSVEKTPKDFFKVLLQSGFFFPSVQDLAQILEKRNETSFLEQKTVDLPISLMAFWNPVIVIIMQKNCIQEFVEELFLCLSQKNALVEKIAACWIYSIISYDEREGSPYNEIPDKKWPCFNWVRLLGSCVQNCCLLTPALLPYIVDRVDPPLEESNKNNLMALVAINLGVTVPSPERETKNTAKANELFTVDALKEDLFMREKDRSPSIWHKPPEDIDWSTTPLGFVFGDQKKFTTNTLPDPNVKEMKPVEENAVPVNTEPKTEVINDIAFEIDSILANTCSIQIKPKTSKIGLYDADDEDDEDCFS